MSKTIAQVVKEYRARMDATEFKSVQFLDDCGVTSEYPDVTGLHETVDEGGKWIEFDYESFTFSKKMHVKMHGQIIKTIV